MKRINEKCVNLIEINKSKFYGVLIPISSPEEAKEVLISIRKEYPKATHYCYAYRVEKLEKSNDDGEPSGTAGRPILECLKNNDLENVLCVVVRYFGGIKLGASGLVRAYVDATKEVINKSELFDVAYRNIYSIKMDYSLYDIVRNYLQKENGEILNTNFDEDVEIEFCSSLLNEEKLINLTNNKIKIILKGDKLVYSKIDVGGNINGRK